MNATRRNFLTLAGGLGALGALGCAAARQSQSQDQPQGQPQDDVPSVDLKEFESLRLDTAAWRYDSDNDCYYQLGLTYCTKPGNDSYESLAIFVPGAYFDATKKGDTYSCAVRKDATVGSLSPACAPAVLPINSLRLNAQSSPESYSFEGLSRYLSAGLVYVYAGFRGRSSGYTSTSKDMVLGGAPWPAVDLKAAIRYLRYNAASLPIDPERVMVFGYGAGGGLSAVLGAMGDSDLYAPYLDAIGAATHDAEGEPLSDGIYGSASWCPITSLDTQDSAYEWMMGQFADADTRADGSWTKLLSTDLANAYGDYINAMDLRDKDDEALTLGAVSDGAYLDGSYYDYVMGTIEAAAADFLRSASWPYTHTPAQMADPCFPGDPNLKREAEQEVGSPGGSSGAATASPSGVSSVSSTVYDSTTAYLSSLNEGNRWMTYSASRGRVRIASLWDFVAHCRPATRPVCGFDMLDRSSPCNQLFGIGKESTLHFDAMVGGLLSAHHDSYAAAEGYEARYADDWDGDLAKKDAFDVSMTERVNAMNPLYTLSGRYDGYGKAKVAPHWRINSGLFQTEMAITAELNLALALDHYQGVSDVSYTPVWGRGFELAERDGDAQDKLVEWVVARCPQAVSEVDSSAG
ncbi:subtype A tannase [Olsenella sp. HMSC062G07]|uniref:subtype A tannase n=1 Tax=Olsenella sp. HMSC062G07 TaxID=1739330 RepID=UPI0008A5F914|nr:subtype A tannase [Olsenella sp. HMSC062G07]OFK23313.1 tannase [Olsenella sp. HMSC062G07]